MTRLQEVYLKRQLMKKQDELKDKVLSYPNLSKVRCVKVRHNLKKHAEHTITFDLKKGMFTRIDTTEETIIL